MSAPNRIDFDRSRAVLIGTAAYTEGLDPMPAAANSLRHMEDLLTGLCGWPPSAVTSLKDLSTGDRRLRKVSELIGEATDVLLLYYVGHGLLLPGDDLGLALTDTDTHDALRLTTTYRLSTLREQLRYHCHARLKLTILDCCFAGIAGGLPGMFSFAPNRAFTPVSPGASHGGPKSAPRMLAGVRSSTTDDGKTRLLADAKDIAAKASWVMREEAMEKIAPVIAAISPERAEGIARSLTGKTTRESTLREVAVAAARSDPDHVERIAQSITPSSDRRHALSDIAEAVAAADPDRAERIALAITVPEARVASLVKLMSRAG
jgi:hypothetical protein